MLWTFVRSPHLVLPGTVSSFRDGVSVISFGSAFQVNDRGAKGSVGGLDKSVGRSFSFTYTPHRHYREANFTVANQAISPFHTH